MSVLKLITVFLGMGLEVIATTIFACYLIGRQKESELMKQKINYMENQLGEQINNYEGIYNIHKETRSIQHDLKNFIVGINGLLIKNDVIGAQAFIYEKIGTVLAFENIVDTQMPVLDAILTEKICRAKENGIFIDYRILLEQKTLISQMDLSIVVANALDNAIEAVTDISDPNRTIFFKLINNTGYILVVIENPSLSGITLETSKRNKTSHGFGLYGIRKIAQKYNGSVNIKNPNNKFILSVILKNREIVL